LKAGRPVVVPVGPTLADGLAVPQVGEHSLALARPLIDRVVTVGERDIALAILRLIELEKSVVEGAGAAPLAACLARLVPELEGRKVVLPLSGGNIDTTVLGRIIERGLVSDGRLCQLITRISDRPGGLAAFASVIASEGANIMDIAHDRTFAEDELNTVTIRCAFETRDAKHLAAVRARLTQEGFVLRED
jgi:threonine dehydratase